LRALARSRSLLLSLASLSQLFRELPLNEEKKSALVGLGAAPTPELRERALEFALSGEVRESRGV
jgi:hypothetical protein